MCPITGMSADAIARIVSPALRPPSSFTASAPAWSSRPALRIASAVHAWYDRNGMSATRNARFRPRAAASVCRTMSSIVTFRVLEWPRTTCPSESPTRITSTPDVVEDAGEHGVVRRDHHDFLSFGLHPPKVEDVGLAHRHLARPLFTPQKNAASRNRIRKAA